MIGRRTAHRLAAQLDRIEDRVKTIEVAFLVSGPNNPVVAEAYNGLRQQVVMAAAERRAHLAQLADFAAAIADGATSPELGRLVDEWMRQHSLVAVGPDRAPDAYDVVGNGPVLRVERSAYVDAHTGAVVSLGRAVASRAADEVPPAAALTEPVDPVVDRNEHEHEEVRRDDSVRP